MTTTNGPRPAMPLAAKLAAAIAVALVAEGIFSTASEIGGTIGLLALIWVAALALTRPIVRRTPAARNALVAAAGFALVLVDDPNPLALLLGWIAISLAALLPGRRFDDALRWAQRLGWHALVGLGLPWRDLAWSAAARRRTRRGGVRAGAAMLVVPVVGGAVFLTLFANANPLIGDAFGRIALPDLTDVIWRTILAAVMLTAVWATLRPRLSPRIGERFATPGAIARFDLGVATLVLSLATFNAIFAVQNLLDILFLWSGAASPTVRRLVTLWIAQNLLLVASSALRLVDYIAAYAMTGLRLAALAWMALVATGLALILWRLLRGRSAAWLVNANALAAALMLSGASVVDLGATAAAWNADVAIDKGRAGPPLDLCYLARLGPSGLVALARLERHAKDAGLRDRLTYLRWQAQAETTALQADWRSWSGRNVRRLAAVEGMAGRRPPQVRRADNGRACDGSIVPPPAWALTKAAQR